MSHDIFYLFNYIYKSITYSHSLLNHYLSIYYISLQNDHYHIYDIFITYLFLIYIFYSIIHNHLFYS